MAGPTQLELYKFADVLLAEARLATITDDVESRYAMDDAWPRAVRFVLRQAAWRFALRTQNPAGGGSLINGYTNSYVFPADHLRLHALFLGIAPGQEFPIDFREQGAGFSTGPLPSDAALNVRYISSDYLDPAFADWPEQFAQAVAAYLAFLVSYRVTGNPSAQAKMSQLFGQMLDEAKRLEALPEDDWLPYQRDGAFLTAARTIIGGANWTFPKALKTIQVAAQSPNPAADGWPYRFALPEDWLRTQALFVTYGGTETPFDVRQTAEQWSTATEYFTARYLSTDALDATLWPEAVSEAVLAYLDWKAEPKGEKESAAEGQADAADFQRLMAAAMEQYAIAEDPWLRFQLSGLWRQALGVVAEKGRWRFAIKTIDLTASSDPNAVSDGSVSPGYAFRFLKPNDWQRTIWLYYAITDGLYRQWCDVDFRDELDAFHANYSPIRLRYLTRLVLDATRWPSSFREAVRLYCLYVEASADPRGTARAAAILKEFTIACSEAEAFDDEREVPPVRQMGRFVRGRYASRSFSISSGAATPSISTGTPTDTTPPAGGADDLTLDGETLTLDGETLTLP